MTLKELRQSLGLTQEQFSERLGLLRGTYTQYETGRRAITLKFARRVSEAFNMQIKVTLTDVTFNDHTSCACGNEIKEGSDQSHGICRECR